MTRKVRVERPSDTVCIEKMYSQAFGPGRFARTAYRIREMAGYLPNISCVVEHQDKAENNCIAGTIRFSEIVVGGQGHALLLGPLVVREAYRGYNYGIVLMEHGLLLAKQAGYRLVVLVGDLAYYEKVGFLRIPKGQIWLPAPFDPNRLLAYELKDDCLKDFRGEIVGKPMKEVQR